MSSEQESSGPYASSMAGLGGLPSISVDVPITSVFMFLFVLGAAVNMTIFQMNKRKGHKFNASGALFGLCCARTVTSVMRIAWATHPSSVPVAIAANIFVNAGVIIIIIINLIFAQRLLRASHPNIGWHKAISIAYKAYYASIILMLVALITAIVQQSYTLYPNTLRIDRDITLVGATYNALASFLPILIVLLCVLLPRTDNRHVDKFGTGRHRTKVAVMLLSSALICMGATFRCAIAYAPRPRSDPAWYHSTACFYCFVFLPEIIVVYLYIAVRVDRRFWIPNGAKGSYALEKPALFTTEEECPDDEQSTMNTVAAKSAQWEKQAEEEGRAGIDASPEPRVA